MTSQKENPFDLEKPKPPPKDGTWNKECFCKIDKTMLPYKIHFFLSFGAISSVVPYVTVYGMSVLHLSATSLGILLTAQEFVCVFTTPLIGLIVDYFNKMKPIIIAILILHASSYIMLFNIHHMTDVNAMTVDPENSSTQVIGNFNLHENNRTNDIHFAQNSSAGILKDSEYIRETSMKGQLQMSNEFKTVKLWLFAIFVTFAGTCTSALSTLSDTVCYEVIKKTGADYGRQRVWGTVGWATVAPLAGYAIDQTGSYLPACIIIAAYSIIGVLNILRLDLLKPNLSSNISKDLRKIFRSGEFVAFEITVFNCGLLVSLIWFYQMLYLDKIGGNQLVGMSQLVQCVFGKLPFLYFAGRIIKKLGHFNCLSLTLSAYLIRYYAYSCLYNQWLILLVDVTHGFTHSVFITTMTSYASSCALPGTETTTQAVLAVTYDGIGAGIGSIVGGVGFDQLGGHKSFFWASIVAAFTLTVNVAFTLTLNKRKKAFDFEKDPDKRTMKIDDKAWNYHGHDHL